MKKSFQGFNEDFQSQFDTVEYIKKGDDEVEVESCRIVGEEDQYEKRVKNTKLAADGRWRPVSDFTAKSWTGKDVPDDSQGICLNPFENHENRLVYLSVDGGITEKGNVLCSECFEFNRQRKEYAESYKCLWRLLWNPEEF
ncbi:MAG: hypothetical protein U5L00_07235 [Desulfovermiculus sp.]|nr:hypothetical protein [Desulfovermiculus sp.]